MKVEAHIYGLYKPDERVPFYIGSTIRRELREKEHKKRFGGDVKMISLYSCVIDRGEWVHCKEITCIERCVIIKFRKAGYVLRNGAAPSVEESRSHWKIANQIFRQFLTPEQLATLYKQSL